MAFVELRNISKRFGGVHALVDVSVAFERGQVHALLGENGAGKSTLIKILTGAERPTEGEIAIDGQVQSLDDPRHAQALGIAAVYQEPTIYPHLSVLENLFMGQEIRGPLGVLDRAQMREVATPYFERLQIDPALLERRMSALSIGYQQMVLIAQALIRESRLIVFDEPTSILSRDETERLFRIIEELRAAGTAIVYITHRLEEVQRIADAVTILTNGRVKGSPELAQTSSQELLRLMAGDRLADAIAGGAEAIPERQAAEPVLVVDGLTAPGLFEDVHWSLPAGCVTGIYGLVGSGRTEVATAVFGQRHWVSGRIELSGQSIRPRHPREAVALGIGYLPEDRQVQGVFASKPLEWNLTANQLPRMHKRALPGLGVLDLTRLRTVADEMMQRFNIKAQDAETVISTLSGGNQQKGLFARWAGLELKVMIFDEPTRGIDVGAKVEIHRFVRQAAEAGTAVAVISSDLEEITAVSDRIIVMRQGRVAQTFEAPPFSTEAVLAAAVGTAHGSPEEHSIPESQGVRP